MSTRREFLAAAGVLAVMPVSALAGGHRKIPVHITTKLQPKYMSDDGWMRRAYTMTFRTSDDARRFCELAFLYFFRECGEASKRSDADIFDLYRVTINKVAMDKRLEPPEWWNTERQRRYMKRNGFVFTGDMKLYKPPRAYPITATVTTKDVTSLYMTGGFSVCLYILRFRSEREATQCMTWFSQDYLGNVPDDVGHVFRERLMLPLARDRRFSIAATDRPYGKLHRCLERHGVIFTGDTRIYPRTKIPTDGRTYYPRV